MLWKGQPIIQTAGGANVSTVKTADGLSLAGDELKMLLHKMHG